MIGRGRKERELDDYLTGLTAEYDSQKNEAGLLDVEEDCGKPQEPRADPLDALDFGGLPFLQGLKDFQTHLKTGLPTLNLGGAFKFLDLLLEAHLAKDLNAEEFTALGDLMEELGNPQVWPVDLASKRIDRQTRDRLLDLLTKVPQVQHPGYWAYTLKIRLQLLSDDTFVFGPALDEVKGLAAQVGSHKLPESHYLCLLSHLYGVPKMEDWKITLCEPLLADIFRRRQKLFQSDELIDALEDWMAESYDQKKRKTR